MENTTDTKLSASPPLPAPAGSETNLDKNRGLYGKFIVERTDGSSAPGRKHDRCRYFVLDLTHDRHAPAAIRAYADSCRTEYPLLAADLDALFPNTKLSGGGPLSNKTTEAESRRPLE